MTALHRWALVPLRLVIGWGFVAHGYAKLGRGINHFAAIVDAMGAPAPHVTAWIVVGIEMLGGVALLAGAFVRAVSVPLAAVIITALAFVHLPYGFSSVRLVELSASGARFGPVGYELALVYLVALAALAGSDPTPWSVDALARRRQGRSDHADRRPRLRQRSTRCRVG